MKVYVVSEGEAHEGGTVKDVYLNREDALKLIPMNISQDRNGEHTPGVWWTGRVDYIQIEEKELHCTLDQLDRAREEKKIEAFMEANVNEARIRQLVELLDCSRDKAISILQENQ